MGKTGFGDNTEVSSNDALAAIRNLKQQSGKDIVVYGSGKLSRMLVANAIVDEFQIWMHPVAIGQLLDVRPFYSGVVLLIYGI